MAGAQRSFTRRAGAVIAPVVLVMMSGLPAQAAELYDAPAMRPCPGGLDGVSACYGGRDRKGAYYLIAIPKAGRNVLVVHAHGGPRHVAPAPNGSDEDLVRFAPMVRAGFAWIGTTYRNGGYGVRAAAEDVERSRAIYWQYFSKPRLTILHGQSYGGNVVAKLAESGALDTDGTKRFDGVFLTSAAVGKRLDTYDTLIDLRVVYQFFCRNLPLPAETPYPAWQGLQRGSTRSRENVRHKVDACTGVDKAAVSRTPAQRRALKAILGATGLAETQLAARVELTTIRLQDVVMNFLGGRNPFDNTHIRYRRSGQDAALNRGVERFSGSQEARDLLSYDSDLRGMIAVPTIALHARFDPVVDYRAQLQFRKVVEQAGQSHLLLQLLTRETEHSTLSEPATLASLLALVDWIDRRRKPTLADVESGCTRLAADKHAQCQLMPLEEK